MMVKLSLRSFVISNVDYVLRLFFVNLEKSNSDLYTSNFAAFVIIQNLIKWHSANK